MNDLLEAALRYAELGYRVFPCAPGRKTPITHRGFLEATTDAEQILSWWQATPTANVGVATEGLVVIDVDGSDNPWLSEDRALELAVAPLSLTPSGRHYPFRQPAGRDYRGTTGRLALRVDTRAGGGYIVAPPSIVGGKHYRWAEGMALDVPLAALPEPPAWLVAELDRLATRSPTLAPAADSAAEANPIPTGQRNVALTRLGGAMRRVGMSQAEISAALNRVNQDRCQPPLSPAEVDMVAASVMRYGSDGIATAHAEDHWSQMHDGRDAAGVADPGLLPMELLRVPGFVGEVMDHCLATAPYPNVALAFCGALTLQAFLAGRKVRDPADNRTNIYLLGLAHSAAGKDWPRKVNTKIIHEVGLSNCLGERFASGEGLQDALFTTPAMLFQTDEIDGILQAINKSKDARHESILGTLLTMYSASNSVYPVRRKAGKESPGAIDQPCLVVYGTAIPNHYYEALSGRMLTNGFFARMVIVESGPRGAGQEAGIIAPPPRVLETARWWADFMPGERRGNLFNVYPVPVTVDVENEARGLLAEARIASESEYAKAEARDDPVSTTVWGRVPEQIRKLALLYAISQRHDAPLIDLAAARWATQFVEHQTRRMLFMAQSYVADNPFHAECLKLLRKLREAPDGLLAHSVLLKRMKTDAKSFEQLITTLEEQGELAMVIQQTAGRPQRAYRLLAAQDNVAVETEQVNEGVKG